MVRRGETLWAIARKHGVDVNALALMNGMQPNTVLRTGQRLRLGTGSGNANISVDDAEAARGGLSADAHQLTHTVHAGDTLFHVAQEYHVSVAQVASWNRLSKTTVVLGQKLMRPPARKLTMGFLAGKRALIVGVATDRSIAWGIAQAMRREGATLALSYANDRFKERIEPLAESVEAHSPCRWMCHAMRTSPPRLISSGRSGVRPRYPGACRGVRARAKAARRQLCRQHLHAEAFQVAHDISSYSLTALTRGALPLMAGRAGAVLTLSYLGAVRSLPSYNVMGLAKASLEANVRFLAADLGPRGMRVNGISAGPIKTLAAPASPAFARCSGRGAAAPLRRNVTLEDVGNAAAFLCVGSGGRDHRGDHLRGCRLQHRGHEFPGRRRRELSLAATAGRTAPCSSAPSASLRACST